VTKKKKNKPEAKPKGTPGVQPDDADRKPFATLGDLIKFKEAKK